MFTFDLGFVSVLVQLVYILNVIEHYVPIEFVKEQTSVAGACVLQSSFRGYCECLLQLCNSYNYSNDK